MTETSYKTIKQLRNTTQLKGEILAAALSASSLAPYTGGTVVVDLQDPLLSEKTIRAEWAKVIQVLDPAIRSRLNLRIHKAAASYNYERGQAKDRIALGRPRNSYEVLRQLLRVSMGREAPLNYQEMASIIGCSRSPVRETVDLFRGANLLWEDRQRFALRTDRISSDLVTKLGVRSHTLLFRYERGAMIKSPLDLMRRALPLLSHSTSGRGNREWDAMCLTGTPAALHDAPSVDLMGTPRLALLAQVPHHADTFDISALRKLDDGLELETNALAPAPVSVTIVRSDKTFSRVIDIQGQPVRAAMPFDILLSMLEFGLYDQAMQYLRAMLS